MTSIFRKIHADATDFVNCIPVPLKTKQISRQLIFKMMRNAVMAYKTDPSILDDINNAIEFGD